MVPTTCTHPSLRPAMPTCIVIMHAFVPIRKYMHTCLRIHAYLLAYMQPFLHTCQYVCIHAYMHTAYVQTYTHAYMHTYIPTIPYHTIPYHTNTDIVCKAPCCVDSDEHGWTLPWGTPSPAPEPADDAARLGDALEHVFASLHPHEPQLRIIKQTVIPSPERLH